MKEFNVIVTVHRGDRRALAELNRFGEFTECGFRDVYVGRVPDLLRFLDEIDQVKQESRALEDLSQVTPIEGLFTFSSPLKSHSQC